MTEGELLGRARTSFYNCAALACDVWEAETGLDIRPAFAGPLNPRSQRFVAPDIRGGFVRVARPRSPCLVLFRRVKAQPHIGVFVRGRVIHLSRTGAIRQLLSVASLGYTSVRFYAQR